MARGRKPSSTHSSMRIVTHDPRKDATVRMLVIIAFILCVSGAAALGWYVGGRGQIALISDRLRLGQELSAASEELEELRREVRVLSRGIEIERKASSDVREEVTRLQEEIYKQKKEITFYRNIMSPASGAEVLQIQSLRIYPAVQSGEFRFKLVMIQVTQQRSLIRGSVRLKVYGEQHGEAAELTGNLLGVEEQALDFRFQYFQELEGQLTLPPGFQPSRVEVQASTQGGRKALQAERTFPWLVQEMSAQVR